MKTLRSPLAPSGACPWENEQESSHGFEADLAALPLITVVTPIYKSASTLERTLRSVILQRYPKLEFLVFDGGSTDGTVEILREYEDAIDSWTSEPDKGQSHAINKGFAKATGDILAWINGDDVFLPGALWAIAEAWCKNGRPDFIIADADLVDSNYTLIHRQSYADVSADALKDYRKNYLIQPGVFFSRRAWDECGPVRENLHYAFDFDLFYRMALKFPAVRCHQRVAYSVFHPECKTVRDRVFSIIETALLQAEFGATDVAARELQEIGREHQFLEREFHKNKARKRILFVITEFGLGGAQTFLMRLMRDAASEHDVYFYVLFKHLIAEQFVAALDPRIRSLNAFDLGDPARLREMADLLGIQVVHSHLFHADRHCYQAFQLTDIPVIFTDHGDYKVVDKLGLATLEQLRVLLSFSRRIVVTSEHGKDSYDRFGDSVTSKLHFIPLGVDRWTSPAIRPRLRALMGASDETFVFCCAARGVEEKGWSELYEAFVIASSTTRRPVALWVLGEGPAIDEIKTRSFFDHRREVRFVGFVRNVRDWMCAADAGVLLSKFKGETLNLSLIEALSVGRPVVATDIGAIGETVGRGEHAAGVLVPIDLASESADVESAASTFVSLAERPQVYERLRIGAIHRAKRFAMEDVSHAHLRLVLEVCS